MMLVKKLEALGYILNKNDLLKLEVIAKSTIANDIIDNPLNNKALLSTFGYIPTMGEFIETIMNLRCPAYVQKLTISTKDAGDLIRSAGGKVVLAHPVCYYYEDNLIENDVQKIVDILKPDGIEAVNVYETTDGKLIDEVDKWKNFAKKNNLFYTAGSDFHEDNNLIKFIYYY